MRFQVAAVAALCGLSVTGCSGDPKPSISAGDGRTLRTERDAFGLITCSEATETETCFTHRAIVGVSMGAGGAGQLGLTRPELFDTIGMLGVPIVDWRFMFRAFERGYLGGFCDKATILANLDRVNDPTGPAFCGPPVSEVKFTPDDESWQNQILEPTQDYNHWYRWIDEGRGGSFGRDKLRESFQDISLAFGNALFYNEESPYYPPGLPMDYRSWSDAEKCDTPYVIGKMKHKEYNPDGEYDVIAFCDTRTNSGDFNEARPSEIAMEIGLAVDYNGNGIRDFAEPVITMMHERFEDTGSTPNDTYDWDTNPLGTAGNWSWDEGEPFEDTGLDGVPNTGDYGEGNGKFDMNPRSDNYFAQGPRSNIEKMSQGHLDRMNIYADAGIRDFLMSAGATNWLWGALTARVGADQAKDYTYFSSLTPQLNGDFDFLEVDYSAKGIGKHAYLRYGDPDASEREINRGNGHHVGTAYEIVNRFLMSLTFIQDRFLDGDHTFIDDAGDVTSLIQPHKFQSPALNEERSFGIVLPPGYDAPENKDKTYPVVYFLHGQGMESESLLASAILFFGYMTDSTRDDQIRSRKSDWAKFILVFPDSTCSNDACGSGNFNTNHLGIDGNGPKYADSIYELMAYVEDTYRVSPPVVVPKDQL